MSRILRLRIAVALVALAVASSVRADSKFDGLGNHTRAISTKSPEAQAAFNQGIAFLYAFNHDEAIRSFEAAAKHDPDCAAIHWAIALAHGPHINLPIVDENHAAAAWKSLAAAQKSAGNASQVERDLIDALAKRYANPQPEDRKPLDVAYAEAMRKVWQKYPEDADVGALFAEALMNLWPWDLWTPDGKAQPDTQEIVETLDRVIAIDPQHPLALHLYIHAVEASPSPERAALAAYQLRELQPGLGHMVHMPSHIDVLLGHWQNAIDANEKAIVADTKYRELVPQQNFYRIYMAHNHHMLSFAAMMVGRNERATRAINEMLAEIPNDWLEANAAMAGGLYSMPYEVHIRFGRWDEILAEPEPREILPVTRAFRLYARGVAYAAKGQVEEARAEQRAFLAARKAVPEDALFVFNTVADVMAVAENMLEGEILYREGKVDEAVAALREAVACEDKLRYTEPPDWIQPVRHVLGATLMDAGRYAEAEAVYREDLERHPNNGWSLHDLARSLHLQGKADEAKAVRERFEAVWKDADVGLSSSCYCLPAKP